MINGTKIQVGVGFRNIISLPSMCSNLHIDVAEF